LDRQLFIVGLPPSVLALRGKNQFSLLHC